MTQRESKEQVKEVDSQSKYKASLASVSWDHKDIHRHFNGVNYYGEDDVKWQQRHWW